MFTFDARKKGETDFKDRIIIPNDCKFFAQANVEPDIVYYLSSDSKSLKMFNLLKEKATPGFQFIDLNVNCADTFGELDFKT